MAGSAPGSGSSSATNSPDTRSEHSSAPTERVDPSAATRSRPSPTEPADDETLDADLSALLRPSDDPAALGRLAHYDVLRLVGRGGMGRVFEAFDTALRRTVAIKLLAAPLAASSMARRRFVREARAAAALNHPNVVTVYAVGEHDSVPYIVMEYLRGGALSNRLRTEAPLPPAEVIRVGAQIAHGLSAAHAQGLIHRDIKPANLLVEEGTGRIKITDFGLAQATLDPSESAIPGRAAGTPSFLAPELLSDEEATARSDLFSLGCVLYAMVAGGSPFRGTRFAEVATRLVEETPAPLDQIDPRVPPALAALVAGLLEKSPNARRPGTAAEAAALLDALGAAPFGSSRPAPGAPSRVRLVAASLLVLVALAAFFAWFRNAGTRDGRAPVDESTPAIALRAPDERPLVLEDGLNWVRAVAVSPDGRLAVDGGGLDNDVRLWDLASARVTRRLIGHESWIQAVAISPDGRYALTASGGSWKIIDGQRPGGDDFSVRLWRLADGASVRTFEGHSEPLTGVAFAPDASSAASSSRDHTIRLWPLEGNDPPRRLDASAEVFCLAFTPKGDQILTGTWERALRWDVAAGEVVGKLEGHVGPVLAVAIAPDGLTAATAGADASIRIWALGDDRLVRVLRGHAARINGLAWSTDSRWVASAGEDGTVRLWDVASASAAIVLASGGAAVNCVAFLPRSSGSVAGCHDGALRLWEIPGIPGARPAPRTARNSLVPQFDVLPEKDAHE